jgi:hypothetical protein
MPGYDPASIFQLVGGSYSGVAEALAAIQDLVLANGTDSLVQLLK